MVLANWYTAQWNALSGLRATRPPFRGSNYHDLGVQITSLVMTHCIISFVRAPLPWTCAHRVMSQALIRDVDALLWVVTVGPQLVASWSDPVPREIRSKRTYRIDLTIVCWHLLPLFGQLGDRQNRYRSSIENHDIVVTILGSWQHTRCNGPILAL